MSTKYARIILSAHLIYIIMSLDKSLKFAGGYEKATNVKAKDKIKLSQEQLQVLRAAIAI